MTDLDTSVRQRSGRFRRLVGLAGLGAMSIVLPLPPADRSAAPAVRATGFCEIIRFHAEDDISDPFRDSVGQWCSNTPSYQGTLPAKDVTFGALVSPTSATDHLARTNPATKGFQSLTGFGDRAVSATYLPFSDSSEVEYGLAFVRSCYYVKLISDAYQPNDPGWADRIRSIQAAAAQIDSRVQQGGRYGLPACAGTGTETNTTADQYLLDAIVASGAFTHEEMMQIIRERFPTFPSDPGQATAYWNEFLEDQRDWWSDATQDVVEHIGRITGSYVMDETQNSVMNTLDLALIVGNAQPDGRYEFPVVKALLPVIVKMTENAIGPPSDPQAARAVNRLVRMAIADEIPLFPTTPPS